MTDFLGRWFVVFGLVLLSCSAKSADRVADVSTIDKEPLSLTSYFSVLEDPSGQLTLTDVIKPEYAARFKAVEKPADDLNYGFTASAYWLRLNLENSSEVPVERMLEIATWAMDSLQLHRRRADGGFDSEITGGMLPFQRRPYLHRNFVFPLRFVPGSTTVIYLRLQSTAIVIPARLWEPDAFHAFERLDYMGLSAYYGLAAGLALFNLFLFFVLRDRVYLLYVISVTVTMLTYAELMGLGKEFLWQDAWWWSRMATNTGCALSAATFTQFMRVMLDTAHFLPRLDRLLKALVALFLVSPLGFAVANDVLSMPAVMAFGVTGVLILGTVVYCVYRRQRSAYFFAAAFSVLLLGVIVMSLRALGMLPTNYLTQNILQIGSSIEMILLAIALADRFDQIRRERNLMQQALVDTLRNSERELEERVRQRTIELKATLDDLRTTQNQLVQSEKMASLGKLVTNVAHEINTPIGAVKSSGRSIADALDEALINIPRLFSIIDGQPRAMFIDLVSQARTFTLPESTRAERTLRREVTRWIEEAGIADAENKARIMVSLCSQDSVERYLPLLRHSECDFILATAQSIATIVRSTSNINLAVDRVTKIISTLRSFSEVGGSGEMVLSDLKEGIEAVLKIYANQIRQGVELIRAFDPVPAVRCFPDDLMQVWTHLIHNALQAMVCKGRLVVGLKQIGNEVIVSVGDSGCGIPETLRERIFEPFFTTQPDGEGSGLGLGIVRKIVEKHRGRIDVQSEVGVGSVFCVHLPIQTQG